MIVSERNGYTPARMVPGDRPLLSAAPSARSAAAPVSIPAPEQLKQAAQMINKALETFSRNVQFSVDESTGKAVVKVMDMETGELIRQMPSQEALDIARALDRLQGLLIRQRA